MLFATSDVNATIGVAEFHHTVRELIGKSSHYAHDHNRRPIPLAMLNVVISLSPPGVMRAYTATKKQLTMDCHTIKRQMRQRHYWNVVDNDARLHNHVVNSCFRRLPASVSAGSP